MKVTAKLCARQEVEVEIDFEEFIADSFNRASDRGDSSLQKINLIAGQLIAIPESAIIGMSEGALKTIRDFLLKQADRYLPRTISNPTTNETTQP